jgi:hypothetical protein
VVTELTEPKVSAFSLASIRALKKSIRRKNKGIVKEVN